MSLLVSVIVPVYNVEEYLQKCIDSICVQTYSELEIILIDDGSPDYCGEICDRNALKDSRIVVVHKENGGLSSARNVGLDIAKGDYISFIDADDTVHPRFIEILVGLCRQYDCDIAQCDFLTIRSDSRKLSLNALQSMEFYDGKQALYNLCIGQSIIKYSVVWNKIYRKYLFDEIRFPLGKIHEDEFVNYLLFWKTKKVVDINQYLYYYMQRETSIMNSSFSLKRLDALEAFRKRLLFFKEKGFEKEYIATLYELLYRIDEYYILLKKNTKDCEKICANLQKEKKELLEKLPKDPDSSAEETFSQIEMMESCSYPAQSKIVLYGAGKWGRNYYQWINENKQGIIVGWVDNLWYLIKDVDYPISPLDSLLDFTYDYVLIAIKSKHVQSEVAQNLLSWGIPERKIRVIISDEL